MKEVASVKWLVCCVVLQVLATDMSVHFKHLAELKTLLETKTLTNDGILELDTYKERSEVHYRIDYLFNLSISSHTATAQFNVCDMYWEHIAYKSELEH